MLLNLLIGGFIWGAALSAHQSEGVFGGGKNSDWYLFERTLAENADQAIDHWHRYDEDFALAESLGLDSVRISLAWEKIEPYPGVYNKEVLQHYRWVLLSMRRHGLRPMVALHHFVHPLWFKGWETPGADKTFLRYAMAVEAALGDLCDLWITFNEAGVLLHLGYLKGTYPPQQRSLLNTVKAGLAMAQAHQWVTAYYHQRGQRDMGMVNSQQVYAGFWAPALSWLNWLYIDRAMGEGIFRSDWLGVNYYGKVYVGLGGRSKCQGERVADNGWCMHPSGLSDLLVETAQRYDIPVYVGENGLADANDTLRQTILAESLAALEGARAQVDVRGYYHWSLLDNFEWNYGYAHKFGLIDEERHPRPSAYQYRDAIRTAKANARTE